MVKRSRIDLQAGEIGDNVAVPIPMVDRGRGDPRNILGVIIDCNENDLYTIAVKVGILRSKYTRNEFSLCPQRLLTNNDVNTSDKIITSGSNEEGCFWGARVYSLQLCKFWVLKMQLQEMPML